MRHAKMTRKITEKQRFLYNPAISKKTGQSVDVESQDLAGIGNQGLQLYPAERVFPSLLLLVNSRYNYFF